MSEFFTQLEAAANEPVDVLDGHLDFTGNGRAEAFFAGLTEEDRELIQSYAYKGLGPMKIGSYAVGLTEGYHRHDPERSNRIAREDVHLELSRIGRLLDIYLATDFFPVLKGRKAMLTETADVIGPSPFGDLDMGGPEVSSSNTYTYDEFGWDSISDNRTCHKLQQNDIREHVAPVMAFLQDFVDDPAKFTVTRERSQAAKIIWGSLVDLDVLLDPEPGAVA